MASSRAIHCTAGGWLIIVTIIIFITSIIKILMIIDHHNPHYHNHFSRSRQKSLTWQAMAEKPKVSFVTIFSHIILELVTLYSFNIITNNYHCLNDDIVTKIIRSMCFHDHMYHSYQSLKVIMIMIARRINLAGENHQQDKGTKTAAAGGAHRVSKSPGLWKMSPRVSWKISPRNWMEIGHKLKLNYNWLNNFKLWHKTRSIYWRSDT